jgi:hypothetical protein
MVTPRLLSHSSFKDRLSIDIQPMRPLRAETRAAECQLRSTFRSCRFSRLQRLAPHRPPRACCIPLPTMRFVRFRAGCRLSPTTPPSSRTQTPFEAFPSQHSGNPSPAGPLTKLATEIARRSTLHQFTEVPTPLDVRKQTSFQHHRSGAFRSPGAALRGVTMPEVRCLLAALPRPLDPMLPWAFARLQAFASIPRTNSAAEATKPATLGPENSTEVNPSGLRRYDLRATHPPSWLTLPKECCPTRKAACRNRLVLPECRFPRTSSTLGPSRTARHNLEGCSSRTRDFRRPCHSANRMATQQEVPPKQNRCRRRDRLPHPALATRERDGRNEHQDPHLRPISGTPRCTAVEVRPPK